MIRVVLLLCFLSGLLMAAPQGYHCFVQKSESRTFFSLFRSEARIDAWFFDAARYRLLVLDEGDAGKRYGSLERCMEAERCVAGINGGYFADDSVHSPLGLLRHQGKQLSPFSCSGFTVVGVFYDTGKGLRLERSRRLTTSPERMCEAIQGGPFLVDNGRKVSGLNASRKARRSFVATDGKGNWCIAMTSPLTLDELGAWLASGRALGSFRVKTALNMDGGTSSSFWVSEPHVYKPGVKSVRNYVGIAPRTRSRHSEKRR